MTSEKEETYVVIKACLTSSSHALSESTLIKDYCEFTGESTIPFKKYGFGSLLKFMQTVPGVRTVITNADTLYEAIPTENTQHITDLVKGQKRTRKKNNRPRKWGKSLGTKGHQNIRNAYGKNIKDSRKGRQHFGDQNIRKESRAEYGTNEFNPREFERETIDPNTRRFSHDEWKRMHSDEIRRNLHSPHDEYISNRQRNINIPTTKEQGYDSNEFDNKPKGRIHDNGKHEPKPTNFGHENIDFMYTDKFKRDQNFTRDGYTSNRQSDFGLPDGKERRYTSKEFHNKPEDKIRESGRYGYDGYRSEINENDNYVRRDRNNHTSMYDSDDELRFNSVHRDKSKNAVLYSDDCHGEITDEWNYARGDRNHYAGTYRHDGYSERSVHRDGSKNVYPMEGTNSDRYNLGHGGSIYKGNNVRGDRNHHTSSYDEYQDDDHGLNDGGNHNFRHSKHTFRSSPVDDRDFDGSSRSIHLPKGKGNLSVTISNDLYKVANHSLDTSARDKFYGLSETPSYDDPYRGSRPSKNYSNHEMRKSKREMSDRRRYEMADTFSDWDRRQP